MYFRGSGKAAEMRNQSMRGAVGAAAGLWSRSYSDLVEWLSWIRWNLGHQKSRWRNRILLQGICPTLPHCLFLCSSLLFYNFYQGTNYRFRSTCFVFIDFCNSVNLNYVFCLVNFCKSVNKECILIYSTCNTWFICTIIFSNFTLFTAH